MKTEELLEVVRGCIGLSHARIERVGETGEADTVRVTGFLKISDNSREADLLRRFRRALRVEYAKFFPAFTVRRRSSGIIVLELEYVGDLTLESVMLGKAEGDSVLSPLAAVERVSSIIRHFSYCRPRRNLMNRLKADVLSEIAQALSVNSRASGVIINMGAKAASVFGVGFTPTLCHRDLSTANVVCDKDAIRLIDPRDAVPGAKSGQGGVYGSAAIDCAAFFVSLERKELERERLGLSRLRAVDAFLPFIRAMTSEGVFSEAMYDLCLACAYSVYAACACVYCLSPERRWLYDTMRERHLQVLGRLAQAGLVEWG